MPPEAVNHILDADSSQHVAVEAVKRGAHVVIDGPPGTGKSQTIANAIAELLAAGKTVLFVSEKTAALEVVKSRLDRSGLGDFCLELHSHKANKREVTSELGRCLELSPEAYRDNAAQMRQLADDRRRLNAYSAELHRERLPLGLSAFEIHGRLARLANLADSSLWKADVAGRDQAFLERSTEVLGGLSKCRAVVDMLDSHPWLGCRIASLTQTGLDDARFHIDRLRLQFERLISGTALADLAVSGPIGKVGEWIAVLDLARRIVSNPSIPTEWFEGDPVRAAKVHMRLHEATAKVRALLPRLAQFDPNTLRNIEPTTADFSKGLKLPRELLRSDENQNLRGRLVGLRSLQKKLAKAAALAEPLIDAGARLIRELRLPAKPIPVVQMGKIAQVAKELARGPSIPHSWWDAKRRTEILSALQKASTEEAALQSARAKLLGIFAPVALETEAANVARKALASTESFWRRILPGSGAERRLVLGWYSSPQPDSARVTEDLKELYDYHRRWTEIDRVEKRFARDLVFNAEGRADWDATAEGLKRMEQYEKWKLPDLLKAGLAPGGDSNRDRMISTAASISAGVSELKTLWEELLVEYDAPETILSLACSPEELESALKSESNRAAVEIDSLTRLGQLLLDEGDIPAAKRFGAAEDIASLVNARIAIRDCCRTLSLAPSPVEMELIDGSASAKAAKGLIENAPYFPNPFPQSLVSVLTATPSRDRLVAAVELSERLLQGGFWESWTYLTTALFPASEIVSTGIVLDEASIPEMKNWTAERQRDSHRIEEWVRFHKLRRDAVELGIESVVNEVLGKRLSLDVAPAAFEKRFLGLWLDRVYSEVPVLRDFASDDHDDLIARFTRNDRRSLTENRSRVRSTLLTDPRRPNRNAGNGAPDSSEMGILLREVHKKKRHLPLRKLFAQVPTLLPRLKPCLMMSPLAVSTYLTSPDCVFDVVIFDEASQVRPHDAIGAIARGRQLVVAGDPKQLPPTDFFAKVGDDGDDDASEDGDEGTAGFESLLDVCLARGLIRKRLRWHYRSRREGLIAFSNRFIYEGDLVTFPSPEDDSTPAVRFVHVQDGCYVQSVNPIEATRVAELVLEHFRTQPDRSLGVIAFSQAQQNRILDELERMRKEDPALEEFFREDRDERFFVKNLENVQGDERDAILFSIGYGPDSHGKVAMRFGPLNRQGGERRLNVAVTRARQAMTVVSSLEAADIDLGRTQAEGVRLLRAFLDYASRGKVALEEAISEANAAEFDSPFEREVYDECVRRGLQLHRQVGCGGFKIDLAVIDSQAPGRYSLGIECDGATYHSSATARDRDRLRQSVLEDLGWRLCRIWSTDWLRNREKQVERILAALRKSPVAPIPVSPPEPEPPVPIPPVTPPDEPVTVATSTVAYTNIDEVPNAEIEAGFLAVLREFGATDLRGAIKAVCTRLGFKRLGAKIEARLQTLCEDMIRRGAIIRHEDGRLLTPTT